MNSPVKRSIGDINKNYMSSLLQHNLIIPENEIPDLSYKQAQRLQVKSDEDPDEVNIIGYGANFIGTKQFSLQHAYKGMNE